MTTKRTILSLAAVSGAVLFLAAGAAGAAPLATVSTLALSERASVALQVEQVQYYGRRYVRPGRVYGRPVYGRGYYGRGYSRGAVGAGVAAGVLGGIAAGALLAPGYAAPAPVYGYPAPVYAAPAPVYGAPGGGVEYCMRRFRSYDPSTGTYIGSDGATRYCP